MTDPLALRPLGRTGLQVTGLCVGGSPLANMSTLYGSFLVEWRV